MCGLMRVAILALLVLTACSTVEGEAPSEVPSRPVATPEATPSISTDQEEQMSDTVVDFVAEGTVVEVVMDMESPVAQDFLSMLPITVPFKDFHGMELIAYPPRDIDTTGAQGMAPEVGDLFVYVPWGNFGFFYDTGSLGFLDDLVRIGVTENIEAIAALQGHDVTVTVG